MSVCLFIDKIFNFILTSFGKMALLDFFVTTLWLVSYMLVVNNLHLMRRDLIKEKQTARHFVQYTAFVFHTYPPPFPSMLLK